MLVSFEGVQGTGKTTAAVALAVERAEEFHRRIVSNVHLNYKNYTHFDLAWFLENLTNHELEDCVIVFDEAYQIMDARSSGTKLNKLFSYFIVQTRKRGVDAFICTHHLDHIDKRTRRAIDIRGACRYQEEKPCRRCKCNTCKGLGWIEGVACPDCTRNPNGVPTGGTGIYLGAECPECKGYGVKGWTQVSFLDRRIRKRYEIEIFGNDYWHIFNTRERIGIQKKIIDGIDVVEVV